jgi:hypothetical protein
MAVKFSSASEVTEYLKRKASSEYYNNYSASQKHAYSSTYTTFLGASVSAQSARKPVDVAVNQTCCVSPNGGMSSIPEKVAPGKNTFNPC